MILDLLLLKVGESFLIALRQGGHCVAWIALDDVLSLYAVGQSLSTRPDIVGLEICEVR